MEVFVVYNFLIKYLVKTSDPGAAVSYKCEPSKSNLLALKNMLTKEIRTEEESYNLSMPLLHFNPF